jgi:Family of unknown function (DUF6299)
MPGRRLFSTALAAVSLTLALPALTAGAAFAAAPANDTFAGATVISSLPFSQTLDTSEATTDAADPQACGSFPSATRTVWYSYTPVADQVVTVDASSNSYRVGIGVVTGAPGGFTRVDCNLFTSHFLATAGQTYHMVLTDFDGNGNGILNLSASGSPPPQTALTIDPIGRVNPRTGVATVTGTVSCSNSSSTLVFADLSQPIPRSRTTASAATFDVTCDGDDHPWSISETPYSGKFTGGPAQVSASSSACAIVTCASDQEERSVLLIP